LINKNRSPKKEEKNKTESIKKIEIDNKNGEFRRKKKEEEEDDRNG